MTGGEKGNVEKNQGFFKQAYNKTVHRLFRILLMALQTHRVRGKLPFLLQIYMWLVGIGLCFCAGWWWLVLITYTPHWLVRTVVFWGPFVSLTIGSAMVDYARKHVGKR